RGEVLDLPHHEPLVAVDHEDRQEAAGQPRPDDARAGEVEALRVRLLAEHRDVVPGARPFARDRLRVDVRASSGEQVPVPEEDPHSPAPSGHDSGTAGATSLARAAMSGGAASGASPRTWAERTCPTVKRVCRFLHSRRLRVLPALASRRWPACPASCSPTAATT